MQVDVRDTGSIPGLERYPGGRHGNPFLYSCLENPHGERSLAGYRVHRFVKSQTLLRQLSTQAHKKARTINIYYFDTNIWLLFDTNI